MKTKDKTYNIGDFIYCDECGCQRRINKIEEIVGYMNGNGYYIKYFPCKCGNNITLENPKFIHKL